MEAGILLCSRKAIEIEWKINNGATATITKRREEAIWEPSILVSDRFADFDAVTVGDGTAYDRLRHFVLMLDEWLASEPERCTVEDINQLIRAPREAGS